MDRASGGKLCVLAALRENICPGTGETRRMSDSSLRNHIFPHVPFVGSVREHCSHKLVGVLVELRFHRLADQPLTSFDYSRMGFAQLARHFLDRGERCLDKPSHLMQIAESEYALASMRRRWYGISVRGVTHVVGLRVTGSGRRCDVLICSLVFVCATENSPSADKGMAP